MEQEALIFQMLPLELLFRILEFMRYADLARFCRVSRLTFELAAGYDFVWRRGLKKDFPRWAARALDENGGGDLRKLYLKLRNTTAFIASCSSFEKLKTRSYSFPSFGLEHVDVCDALLRDQDFFSCGRDFAAATLRQASVLNFVHDEWGKMSSGKQSSSIEDGALLIAQMAFPEVDVISRTHALLDEIAGQIDTFGLDAVECTQACMDYLFDRLDLRAADAAVHYVPEASYINCMLEEKTPAIPLTFAVVLHAILRRKHVWLDLINTPRHLICQLRGTNKYVDAYHNEIDTWEYFAEKFEWEDHDALKICLDRDVWMRMLNNLWHSAPHGSEDLSFNVMAMMYHFLRKKTDILVYLRSSYRRSWALNTWCDNQIRLMGLSVPMQEEETPPVRRRSELEIGPRIRVGDFVLVGQFRLRGVAVGWKRAENWMTYKISVMTEENDEEWVMEHRLEALDGSQGVPLRNNNIGKYFSEFNGDVYILNEQTQTAYPDL
jgi:hypothetical protein